MKYLVLVVLLAGCAATPFEVKQNKVLDCVTDLRGQDAEMMEAFEVCRQVYRLKKVRE